MASTCHNNRWVGGHGSQVELVDGSKTKLPNIILTDNEWTEPEAISRYIPYVFENSPKLGVINQDAYHAIMSIVFGIPYDMNDLPACGSEDAKALWQEKFAGRLGFASVGDVYTIVYSLRIKNLALASGICKGIDQRVMKQADVRLVRYWIRMTERLVGKEEVQDKVREYVDNEIYKVDFIRTCSSRRPRRRARSGRCGPMAKPHARSL